MIKTWLSLPFRLRRGRPSPPASLTRQVSKYRDCVIRGGRLGGRTCLSECHQMQQGQPVWCACDFQGLTHACRRVLALASLYLEKKKNVIALPLSGRIFSARE